MSKSNKRDVAEVVGLFDSWTSAPQQPIDLPHNDLAESTLLGTLLVFNNALDRVADTLRPEHFYYPVNGRIYTEVVRRIDSGKLADIVSLKDWFSSTLEVGEVLDPLSYLPTLITCLMPITSIKDYAAAIIDCWKRRRLIEAADEMKETAKDRNIEVQAQVDRVGQTLDAISIGVKDDCGLFHFDEALAGAVSHAQHAFEIKGHGGIAIPTFPRLSKSIAIMPREFSIIGGCPGAGKSAIAWQIAIDIAREMRASGKSISETGGILGISLEMSKEALAIRVLSAASGVPAEDILHGRTTAYQLEQVETAAKELRGLPITLMDSGGLTASRIRRKFTQAQRKFKGKIALCIIDHLNLVSLGDNAKHGGAFGTGVVADELLNLGKDFNSHILGLCQLNVKDIAQRKDKRPTHADLRWSGNWSQNSDNILLLYRPIQWEPKSPPTHPEELEPVDAFNERVKRWHDRQRDLESVASLSVEKVRMGRAGFAIDLIFDGKTTSFTEDPSK